MENLIKLVQNKTAITELNIRFGKTITPKQFEAFLLSKGITKQMALAMLKGNDDFSKTAISSEQFKKWLRNLGISVPVALSLLGASPAQAGMLGDAGNWADKQIGNAKEYVQEKAPQALDAAKEFGGKAVDYAKEKAPVVREMAADALEGAGGYIRGNPKTPMPQTSVQEQSTSSPQELQGAAVSAIDQAKSNLNMTKIFQKKQAGEPLTGEEQHLFNVWMSSHKSN